jgi:hypothetical protein
MITKLETIIPEDEQLRMYGTFVKPRTNGHNGQNRNYDVLSEKDLAEIEDLIAIDEDTQ